MIDALPQVAVQPLPGGSSKVDQLREVAQNFEAMFIQTLLKSMRSTVQKSGLIDGGRGEKIFTDLLDQRLAETTSQKDGGIGLALMIVKNYAKYVAGPDGEKGGHLDVQAGAEARDE